MRTSDASTRRTIDLGDVAPARSRHAGRRSAVTLTGDLVVAGTADGAVRAHDRDTLDERWRAAGPDDAAAVVSAEPFGDAVAVGERGPEGRVRVYDRATGRRRWRYATATDVGEPQKPSRFFRPFVVALATDGDRLYAAARRYEHDGEGSEPSDRASGEERPASRDGERRSFTGVVYAFDETGDVVWTYRTDASPIALDTDGRRVAVAYNRCPGAHQHGLVVLDAGTGATRCGWDPGTDGQRRVGDVSLVDDGAVVASHGDYRGYRLDDRGAERWRVDLATPTEVDGETLYAYPNHVHATAAGAVFVTGNTYSTEGRETAALHPDEHTAFGIAPNGERAWTAPVGGFANGLGTDGARVAVPGAQHFRTRDADVHGVRLFGTAAGAGPSLETDGVVTAVATDGGTLAAIEEPVVYHDDGIERGRYRLLVGAPALG